MNPKKKESLFLGSLFLAVQCLCMVKGDVHFYDFVVSTSYRVVSFCSFILKITVTDELPLLALVFPCAFFSSSNGMDFSCGRTFVSLFVCLFVFFTIMRYSCHSGGCGWWSCGGGGCSWLLKFLWGIFTIILIKVLLK